MIIKNALVFNENGFFEKKDIYVENGKFAGNSGGEDIDASGCYLIPGLTDIHFHACKGMDFSDGTLEAIRILAEYEAQNGITTMVPATMTFPEDVLINIAATASKYRQEENLVQGRAELVGINMEGPFISFAKKGAQNPDYIQKTDIDMLRRIIKASGGCVKLCDIAPETDGAMEFIKEASKECSISLAHTDCDYETAKEAFENGASHMTHLFNAMNPIHHRKPGPITAAAENEKVVVELITDGVHINPAVVRLCFKIFGKERIAIISDSTMATGLGDGEYTLGGQRIVADGKVARLEDGTIAGSITNQMKCMTRAVLEMGISLEDAVHAAAVTPAKAVGIYDRVGSISDGKDANFVLLDRKNLEIRKVFIRGFAV